MPAIGERRVGRRGEQKRRWDRENRLTCACGQQRDRQSEMCRSCWQKAEARRKLRRRERIARMWWDDVLVVDIAAELGTTRGTVSVEIQRMRKEGWVLPFRDLRRKRAAA